MLFSQMMCNATMYPNGELDEHACYIESENGRIDASIDSQLQEIKRKLMDILEENPI